MSRALVVGAGLMLLAGGSPLTAQNPSSGSQSRSLSEEMRDKAETAFYRKHDCRTAARQAGFALDRTRDPEKVDPRLPLVLGRALDCLGRTAEAVIAYAEHESLTGVEPSQNLALNGACHELQASDTPGTGESVEALRRQRDRLQRQLTYARYGEPVATRLAASYPYQNDRISWPWTLGLATSSDNANEYLRQRRENDDRSGPSVSTPRRVSVTALRHSLTEIDARLICRSRPQ